MQLSLKGKLLALVSKWLSSERSQPIFEKLELVALAGMNIGGATYGYDESGDTHAAKFVRDRYSSVSDLVLFDVGAHSGHYSRMLRQTFGKKARIYCFEPSESLFRSLETNLNGLDCNMFRLGLGEQESSLEIFRGENNIPTFFREALDLSGERIESSEVVKLVRLDEFCSQQGIEKINLLKIDVEGFEINVLKGAGRFVSEGLIDFIQFEFGPHSLAARTFFADFYTILYSRYNIFRILPKGLAALGTYAPKHEHFLAATNYLAVSRRFTSE